MKGKKYETIRRCKTKHLNLYNAFLKVKYAWIKLEESENIFEGFLL